MLTLHDMYYVKHWKLKAPPSPLVALVLLVLPIDVVSEVISNLCLVLFSTWLFKCGHKV